MLILIISRSSLKLSQVGSKTRLLGQIIENSYVHSRGHSFDPKFMKLWGMKVCSWGLGHKTKMTTMLINGKNHSKFFSLFHLAVKPNIVC